jgi:hypothetical protein
MPVGGTGLLYGGGAGGSYFCFISYLRQVISSTVEAVGKVAATTSSKVGTPGDPAAVNTWYRGA